MKKIKVLGAIWPEAQHPDVCLRKKKPNGHGLTATWQLAKSGTRLRAETWLELMWMSLAVVALSGRGIKPGKSWPQRLKRNIADLNLILNLCILKWGAAAEDSLKVSSLFISPFLLLDKWTWRKGFRRRQKAAAAVPMSIQSCVISPQTMSF